MAKGRMINKSISYSRKFATVAKEVGCDGALVLTWMIAHLDCEGRIPGDPDVIKGMVCPRIAGITPEVIRQTAAKAQEVGLIDWYEANGDTYISFVGFAHNQPNMRKDREPKSEIPSPLSDCSRKVAGCLPAECRQNAGSHPPEEKRREEKRKEEKILPKALAPIEPAAISIPIIGGKEHGITQAQVDEFSRCYPGINVLEELKKCRGWNIANPQNRKTPKGLMRHLAGWLSRAQDRSRPSQPGNGKQQLSRAGEDLRRVVVGGLENMDAFDEVVRLRERR